MLGDLFRHVQWFFRREVTVSEAISGVTTFGFGLLTLRAVVEKEVWPSTAIMFALNDSISWGLLSIIIGSGQLFWCRLVDRRLPQPWARWAMAILASWLWAMALCGTVTSGVGASPGATMGEFGFLLLNVVLVLRVFFGAR
jgi:vacuolar-type H+-ATPase subunit I/STV1